MILFSNRKVIKVAWREITIKRVEWEAMLTVQKYWEKNVKRESFLVKQMKPRKETYDACRMPHIFHATAIA
jgi:hypothetical protein